MTTQKLTADFAGYVLSSDTMREEDLIPTFTRFIKEHAEEQNHDLIKRANELKRIKKPGYSGFYYEDEDDADWILEELFDALEKIAPDGCYFGAHEGDGACYGFWLSDDTDDAELEDEDTDAEIRLRNYFDLIEEKSY